MLTPKSFQYSITCLANSPTRIAKLIDVRLNFFPTTLARCVGFRYWRFDWTSPCLWSSLSVSVSCSDFIFFCIIITWNETTVTGTTSYKNLEWWVVVGKTNKERREPWSSGYGRRLTFQRLWVRIPVPSAAWTWHIFILICCKNCNDVCLKRPKINKKEAGVGPFKKRPIKKKFHQLYAQIFCLFDDCTIPPR